MYMYACMYVSATRTRVTRRPRNTSRTTFTFTSRTTTWKLSLLPASLRRGFVALSFLLLFSYGPHPGDRLGQRTRRIKSCLDRSRACTRSPGDMVRVTRCGAPRRPGRRCGRLFLFLALLRRPVHVGQFVESGSPGAQILVFVLLVVCTCDENCESDLRLEETLCIHFVAQKMLKIPNLFALYI